MKRHINKILAWGFLTISAVTILYFAYAVGIFESDKIIVTAESNTNPGYKVVFGEYRLNKLVPDSLKNINFYYDYVGTRGVEVPYAYDALDQPWDYYYVINGTVAGKTDPSLNGYWYPVFQVTSWWRIHKVVAVLAVIFSSLTMILYLLFIVKQHISK